MDKNFDALVEFVRVLFSRNEGLQSSNSPIQGAACLQSKSANLNKFSLDLKSICMNSFETAAKSVNWPLSLKRLPFLR